MTRLTLVLLALCLGVFAAPAPAQRDVLHDESDLVRISAGWFSRGLHELQIEGAMSYCRHTLRPVRESFECSEERFRFEVPRRRIFLSPYYIDRFEVTRGKYARCVRAGACPPPRSGNGDERFDAPEMPVTGVSWDDAVAYCRWTGGALPTESQWERAARGTTGRRFPWGNIFNDRVANHGRGNGSETIDGYEFVAPVGSYPDGRSRDGVYDMAGNVWEWTRDAFDPENLAWAGELPVDPRGADTAGQRVIRGGSWRSSPVDLRSTTRYAAPEQEHSPDLGFRCVYDDS